MVPFGWIDASVIERPGLSITRGELVETQHRLDYRGRYVGEPFLLWRDGDRDAASRSVSVERD